MNVSEQGARRDRHFVIPRTLLFVTRKNPQTAANEVLLLKGAPTKRLWANLYNGLGGHVEAGEDIVAAAQRELAEEAGLHGVSLRMRGLVHIHTGQDSAGATRPGVLLFVFVGELAQGDAPLSSTAEGTPEWLPIADLAALPLVDDLYTLLPPVLAGGDLVYANYIPDETGRLHYHFHR